MQTTKPQGIVGALDTIEADQQALRNRLDSGFQDTTEILLWLHRCSVHTIGEIRDEWFADVATSRWKRASLLADQRDRDQLGNKVPDERLAKQERGLIDDQVLMPAMNQAIRVLDKRATEYGDKGSQIKQPDKQKYPALRPGLLDLKTRQRNVLKAALGKGDDPNGLTDMEDVRTWRDAVARATRGKWLPDINLWSRMVLMGDTDAATLHHYIGHNFLPAANAAIRETASTSEESVNEDLPNQRKFNS